MQAVAGVDLEVARGEAIALVGPSGSGKSTLLNLLGGLDRPSGGEIWVDGEEMSHASGKRLVEHRKRRVGFIFQSFNLLPYRTALENVEVPMMVAGLSRGERRERARTLLKEVGLEARMSHRPSQLSGGEQQRVAIARALVTGPRLVLADEPTGNLDAQTGEDVGALLLALCREHNSAVIVATHNEHLARACDRVMHLRNGALGMPDDVS